MWLFQVLGYPPDVGLRGGARRPAQGGALDAAGTALPAGRLAPNHHAARSRGRSLAGATAGRCGPGLRPRFDRSARSAFSRRSRLASRWLRSSKTFRLAGAGLAARLDDHDRDPRPHQRVDHVVYRAARVRVPRSADACLERVSARRRLARRLQASVVQRLLDAVALLLGDQVERRPRRDGRRRVACDRRRDGRRAAERSARNQQDDERRRGAVGDLHRRGVSRLSSQGDRPRSRASRPDPCAAGASRAAARRAQ